MASEATADKAQIRILYLAANPRKSVQLQLGREIREINSKIGAASFRDRFEIISCWATRPCDLHQALLEHRPHIVHFSGHILNTEELVLEQDQGEPKLVGKAALARLFSILKDNVRIVVLNACNSRAQAEALCEHVDCAIGMHELIGDDAAIEFAGAFYRALGYGRSVWEAFQLGRSALELEGVPEERAPQLLVRPGVDTNSMVLARADEERATEPRNVWARLFPVLCILAACVAGSGLALALQGDLQDLLRARYGPWHVIPTISTMSPPPPLPTQTSSLPPPLPTLQTHGVVTDGGVPDVEQPRPKPRPMPPPSPPAPARQRYPAMDAYCAMRYPGTPRGYAYDGSVPQAIRMNSAMATGCNGGSIVGVNFCCP